MKVGINMKNSKNKMYEVELKSKALLREGKKSLITYFQGGPKKLIVSNLKYLYPQYTNPEDKPQVDITPITFREFEERKNGTQVNQKRHLVKAEGNVNL
jgi:hypothetical protein